MNERVIIIINVTIIARTNDNSRSNNGNGSGLNAQMYCLACPARCHYINAYIWPAQRRPSPGPRCKPDEMISRCDAGPGGDVPGRPVVRGRRPIRCPMPASVRSPDPDERLLPDPSTDTDQMARPVSRSDKQQRRTAGPEPALMPGRRARSPVPGRCQ